MGAPQARDANLHGKANLGDCAGSPIQVGATPPRSNQTCPTTAQHFSKDTPAQTSGDPEVLWPQLRSSPTIGTGLTDFSQTRK